MRNFHVVLFSFAIVMSGFLYGRNLKYNETKSPDLVDKLMPIMKVTARPKEEYKVHKIGKVWSATSNFGIFGDPAVPQGLPSMEWPGGSNTHHLWEGRFWIGAIVDGIKMVSHAEYGNYEFKPSENSEFYMGPGKSIEDSYVEYDDFEESVHTTAPLGIHVFQRGLTWSTPEYDDFIAYEITVVKEDIPDYDDPDILEKVFVSWVYDCDVGPGYDPSDPHIDDAVDYDGWDGPDTDTDMEDIVSNVDWGGDGICDEKDGYTELGIPYGWEYVGSPSKVASDYDPSKIRPDGFFDEWTLILDEDGPPVKWQVDDPTMDWVAGEIAVITNNNVDRYEGRFEVGDTIKGYLFPRNMSYMYDADDPTSPEDDTGEEGNVPGFIGGRIIYTDFYKLNGPYRTTPEDTFPRPYSHQWWNWESDPGTDKDKYDYMNASHAASTIGGVNYHFLPHPFRLNAPTFDYRFMITTGPFQTLSVGDTLRFVWVSGVGKGIAGLRENMDNAVKAYYSGSKKSSPYEPSGPDEDLHWIIPVPPPVPSLVYSPADRGVKLSWDTKAETTLDPMLGYIDFEGYRVYRAVYSPENWELIAAFDNVDAPVYVIDFETGDTLNNGEPVDLPDITHTFVDTGGVFLGEVIERPKNNFPYYYVVTAYDSYKPADPVTGRPEFKQIESSKSNYLTDPETGKPLPVYPKVIYDSDVQLSKLNPKVVPNPYVGASLMEARYEDKIAFINLPPTCVISIYSMTGDLIKKIEHTDGTDIELWDMVSRNTQDIVSGVYIFVVEDESDKFIGKFIVLRGE